MLNQEYPKFEKGSFEGIEISLSEPNVKINLRGKKKEFFTKIGKIFKDIHFNRYNFVCFNYSESLVLINRDPGSV